MFCSECGQQNADDNKFCMKCGKKLVTEQTVSSSSEATVKPVTLVSKEGDQTNSLPSVDSKVHVSTELKESGTVTAMSVIGLVFGLIGMLGSFIPCLGSFAFYIALPAAIASGIGLGIAYSQNAKRTFAIVALTISLIGVVISGWQLYSIASVGQSIISESKRIGESPVRETVDPVKYVGMWKYDEFGGKHYARITKDESGRFKYEEGYSNDGEIIWLDNTKDGENKENIHLTLSNGKLNGEFVSNNFRETHGINFTYNITLILKSENRLLYSLNGEKAMEAVRIRN